MLLAKKDVLVTGVTGRIGNGNEIVLDTIPQTTPRVADDALNLDTHILVTTEDAQVSRLWVLGRRLVERKGNRRKRLRKESQ